MPSRINIGPENGPYVGINEENGNLQLEDNSGNVVAEWDETNAQWDFANNTLNNVDSLNSNSVNTENSNSVRFVDDSMSVGQINDIISNASAASTNGARISVVFKSGQYGLTDRIQVSDNVELISKGAHVFVEDAWPENTGMIEADSVSNFVIDGFDLDADDPELDTRYCIQPDSGCEDFVISRNRAKNAGDDNIAVENNSNRWAVVNNWIFDVKDDPEVDDSGLEIEVGAKNGVVAGNWIEAGSGADYGILVKTREGLAGVENVQIVGNTIITENHRGLAVVTAPCKNVSIVGNSFVGNGTSRAITLSQDVENITVSANTIDNYNRGVRAILGSSNITISNNTFDNCERSIVTDDSVSDLIATGNLIRGGLIGILPEGENISVKSNHIYGIDSTGVLADGTSFVDITDNQIYDCDSRGIRIQNGNDGYVAGNVVHTSPEGIELRNANSPPENYVIIHNDLRDTTTPLQTSEGTGIITDPVNQDETDDYNLV